MKFAKKAATPAKTISRDEPAVAKKPSAAPVGTPAAASAPEAPSPLSPAVTGGDAPAAVKSAGESLTEAATPTGERILKAMEGAPRARNFSVTDQPRHVHAWDRKD